MTVISDPFFPASQRVIYDISPLFNVVCQIRFPSILRIESEPPANFQEAIRDEFPLIKRNHDPALGDLPAEVAQLVGAATKQRPRYHFFSSDEKTNIVLASDSLAVSTKAYSRWERFESVVQLSVEALISNYRPSFATRIGLRYQNALVPSVLDMAGEPWSEFLSPNIVGELLQTRLANNRIAEAHRHLRVVAPDSKDGFLLQHGIGMSGDEQAYIVDMDFYSDERIEVSHALEHLRKFHSRAGHAFRWCISGRVHAQLGPNPIEETVD